MNCDSYDQKNYPKAACNIDNSLSSSWTSKTLAVSEGNKLSENTRDERYFGK